MEPITKIKNTVEDFSDQMIRAMTDNMDKGDWDHLAAKYLLSRIDHNRDMLFLTMEMAQTVKQPISVKRRCVNLANYAMMLASQCD